MTREGFCERLVRPRRDQLAHRAVGPVVARAVVVEERLQLLRLEEQLVLHQFIKEP